MYTKPICDAGTKPYYPALKTCDFESRYSNDRQTDKVSKRSHTATITCPTCHNKAKLHSFGEGWVGVCCNQLVYNQRNLPGEQGKIDFHIYSSRDEGEEMPSDRRDNSTDQLEERE